MSRNIPLLLSHCAAVCMGTYGLYLTKNEELMCVHITFGLTALTNIFGIGCYLSSTLNCRLRETYELTRNLEKIFVFPCFTTSLWLENDYSFQWSWLWVALSMCPFVYLMLHEENNAAAALLNLSIFSTFMGLVGVSFTMENYYGIAAAIIYGLAYIFCNCHSVYNFIECFFIYFVLKTLDF